MDAAAITGLSPSALLPQISVALLLLAITSLLFRAFREKYLLGWALGWCSYMLFRFADANAGSGSRAWHAIQDVSYGLTAALFAASVFYYVGKARRVLPAAIIAALLTDLAIYHAAVAPGGQVMPWILYGSWTALCAWAAAELAIFNRGRGSLSPWLLVAVLTIWPIENPDTPSLLPQGRSVFEIAIGASMLLVILDDLYRRLRRLAIIDAVAAALAESREFAPMVSAALEHVREVVGAEAAWFRLLDGNDLIVLSQVGVSAEYLKQRAVLDARNSATGRCIADGKARVIRPDDSDPNARERLREYGFDHVLVVPVIARRGPVGALTFGARRPRSYTTDEYQFLATTARHLGTAIENLRMFEQIVYSHRQWISTFDSISDVIVVHDDRGEIIRANRALSTRLGRAPADIVGMDLPTVLGKAGQPCPYCARAYTDTFADAPDPCFGGYSAVASYSYRESGEHRLGTVHVIRDTTASRMAEQRYKMLFDGVLEGAFISTPDGRIIDCNDAFVRMMGYSSREEILQLDVEQNVYADPKHREAWLQAIDAAGHVQGYEVTLRRKDGSVLTALESSFATRDASGKIERFQGFMLDITAKKQAELELRRRNEQLATLNALAAIAGQAVDMQQILQDTLRRVKDLFRCDTASIFLLDDDGHTLRRRAGLGLHFAAQGVELQVSDTFIEVLRRQHVEIIAPHLASHFPPGVLEVLKREGVRTFLWAVLWGKDRPIGALAIASRADRAFTQEEQDLMVSLARQLAGTLERERLHEQTVRAYDDLRHTQEQLLQSEKMSAVGQLIAGVAHELNNPLTAILGYSELLAAEAASPRSQDFIQKIMRQAQRTHRVVQNLLSFARQRKPQKEQVDLATAVEETLQLRDYDLKLNNITITRDFALVPPVVADGHQLEQVFLNIVNNAADAILERSRSGTVNVRVYVEGGNVCASFHDNGPGLTDASRVFDPFYTTKQVGKGTGLGLSICYGIVKEHGGEITAQNHPQGGAVFIVKLPAAAVTEEAPVTPAPRTPSRLLRGRILVAESDAPVEEFVREAITGAGGEVRSVRRGHDAIAALETERFDAIILAARMPGAVNGFDVYTWLKDHKPGEEQQVIITLSDVHDQELRSTLASRSIAHLVKPFEVAELIATIRRVLANRSFAVGSKAKSSSH